MISWLRGWVHALVWVKRHIRRELDSSPLEVLLPRLSRGAICIDVGAHAGAWSVPLASATRRVFAFEALPYYATVLRRTARMLGKRNITVVNAAVQDVERETRVVYMDPSHRRLTGYTHLQRLGEDDSVGAVTVHGITLDGYFTRSKPDARVELLKCDVEGAELLVLKGATGLIRRDKPLIYLELVDKYCRSYGYTPKNVFELLESCGYQAWTVTAGGRLEATSAQAYDGKGEVFFEPRN